MLRQLRMGFTVATGRDMQWVREHVGRKRLHHRTGIDLLPKLAAPLKGHPDANAMVDLRRPGPWDDKNILRWLGVSLTVFFKDYRNMDFNPKRWLDPSYWTYLETNYVYLFLDKPDALQEAAQNYGDTSGAVAWVSISGADLIAHLEANPDKALLYRPGDKAVVLRGGYQGPASVTPAPAG